MHVFPPPDGTIGFGDASKLQDARSKLLIFAHELPITPKTGVRLGLPQEPRVSSLPPVIQEVSSMIIRSHCLLAILATCWLTLSPPAWSQEDAPTNQGSEEAAAAETDDSFREETIYIPYDRLKKVFEKEGRGVFLPYEKFQELWKAARGKTQAIKPPERPVDALISEIESEATIGDQVVDVTATLQIELLGEGWVEVPLRLNNSAIRSARIGDEPARLTFDAKTGHKMLFNKEGKEPKQLELKLEYTRAFTKTPGQSSVAFAAPQAPINRWTIQVPEKGMAVQVEPMIAATETPEGDGEDESKPSKILAFVGAAPTVRIAWNPKAEGASGLAAFATVQAEHTITIAEGVVRSSNKLDYAIARSTLTELTLEVPADQKVINVFDRNVKRWEVVEEDGKQTIRVELFEATQGNQTLMVELERFTGATDASYEVTAPVVTAVGVGRQQGTVVVRLEDGLQGEMIRRVGLLQVDQNDLSPALRKQQWNFAYRYGAVPFELQLRVEKVKPRISVAELIDAELTTSQLLLNWQAVYTIEDAGVFQLRVDLPDGFEVRTVQGKAIGDAQPAAIDAHHRIANDSPTWLINLSKKAIGKVGVTIQLRKRLDDPNLLAPTGDASTIPVPLPHATESDVEFSRGAAVVSAPESLRINPGQLTGLRSVSFTEAYETIPASRSSNQVRPVLAFAFSKGETDLSITAERRRPLVTVNQLLQSEIASGVVKYQAKFFYDVKYSGVKSLRIDVPSSLTSDIRNTTSNLRQDELTPAPDDVPDGYTAWTIAGENELLGTVAVTLAWEKKLDELEIGKSQDISIPRLIPMGVDRSQGQIVVSKSESIDIEPTGAWVGLQPIDPQNDLMKQANIPGAAMAFEFVDAWELSIKATRYELEESKLTSVDRGVVRSVVLEQGELSIQALYRIRSARQRLAIRLPEGVEFDSQPLKIGGQPVTPERGEAGTIFAPLVDQDPDRDFLLELRYTVEGRPSQLDLPEFPDDPAVQKVYLCVYIPDKRAVIGSEGPWSDEQRGSGAVPLWFVARPPTDSELIDWVSEGSPGGASSARTFATGKASVYVYSTLRPETAPDGSLRLRTVSQNALNGLVVLVVAVFGLPLFRRSLRIQIALLLLITTVMLLIGVFAPNWREIYSVEFSSWRLRC